MRFSIQQQYRIQTQPNNKILVNKNELPLQLPKLFICSIHVLMYKLPVNSTTHSINPDINIDMHVPEWVLLESAVRMFALLPYSIVNVEASTITQMILPIADGFYYANIALFWLYVLIIFCRVNSPKLRVCINFAQIVAMLQHFAFIFDQTSQRYINSISAYNFSYLLSLYTCPVSDTWCSFFQYLWQPFIVLPIMLFALLISYLLFNTCYKYSLDQSITFKQFWYSNWFMLVFMFFDYTAVIMGYNITQMGMSNSWGWIALGVYAIFIVLLIVKLFRTINNTQQQGRILYRAKHSWAYAYDQNYHLHYIDFLYTQAKFDKIKPEDRLQANTSLVDLNKLLTTQKKQVTQGTNLGLGLMQAASSTTQFFLPHSNLLILQLLLKILCGVSVSLLYTYKPAFLILPLLLLINIFVCWVGAFFYYDKLTLLLYFILSAVTGFVVSCYWITLFWVIFMGVSALFLGLIGGTIIGLFFTNKKIQQKLVNRMFFIDGQEKIKTIQQKQQQSNEQSDLKDDVAYNDSEDSQNPLQITKQNEQANPKQNTLNSKTETKRQPFIGTLTDKSRKTRMKHNTLIPVTQAIDEQGVNAETDQSLLQQQNNQQHPASKKEKSKTIYKDVIKQDTNQQQNSSNLIKHSKYQSKMAQLKSKVAAKNKTKNPFEDLQKNQPNNNNENDRNEGKVNSEARNTNKKNTGSIGNKDDDFLSNVLQEPEQEQLGQQNKK